MSYTCTFCKHPFQERKFCLDGRMYFCLPECLMAHRWYILDYPVDDKEICEQEYFSRKVNLTPLDVAQTDNPKIYAEWVNKGRYEGLSKSELEIAKTDLFVKNINNTRK